MNETDDRENGRERYTRRTSDKDGAKARSVQSTSFIRLHAKYRERGDVLTRDNHEIMRAISATFRFILAFYSSKLSVVAENRFIPTIITG